MPVSECTRLRCMRQRGNDVCGTLQRNNLLTLGSLCCLLLLVFHCSPREQAPLTPVGVAARANRFMASLIHDSVRTSLFGADLASQRNLGERVYRCVRDSQRCIRYRRPSYRNTIRGEDARESERLVITSKVYQNTGRWAERTRCGMRKGATVALKGGPPLLSRAAGNWAREKVAPDDTQRWRPEKREGARRG